MAKKHAILIANTEYRDGKLAGLAHPGLAYAELAEALRDPARGAFSQVETLVNANLSHVLNTLDRFFSRKPADDVLLVYVGAHGFLDSHGELFLALKESDRFRLKSTALMAAVLGMNMDQCPSPHKLLILDCRFHSPYQDGRGDKDGPKIDPAKVFTGRGLPKQILVSAETAGMAAPKVAPPAPSSTQKLQIASPKDFTRALAEAIRPPTAAGGRAPFTVADWWNAAAAELKATKAEPPLRLAVGEPPLTVLRGASLPRHEMAMSAPGGETAIMMPVLPPEPETDWSRLSGIFPLEMIAPDLAPARPAKPEATPIEPPVPRGDQTLVADKSFIEGADLVLRARREIESATPADLSDPDAGTLESPLSTSPTLELPENPEVGDLAATGSPPGTAEGQDSDPSSGNGPALRPDATLFFDLRLPPDLSGNSTLLWDPPANGAPTAGENPSAPPSRPPSPLAPPKILGPRDTFTGLRERLKAQEEEEQKARLKAEKEESAQREKLDRWKSRWQARIGAHPSGSAALPEAKAENTPPTVPPDPAAPAPNPPKGYQARIAALQKTLFVPGPDVDPEGTTPPQPLAEPAAESSAPATPAAPATPPVRDGLATVIVSKEQFLNTGVHKVPTELAPGATIMVPKEEFYGTGAPPGATIMVPKEEFYGTGPATGTTPAGTGEEVAAKAEPRPARPIRSGSEAGRARKTGRIPKVPGGRDRNQVLLWALASLAPVGLGLFLFFGAQSGMFRIFGFPGEDSPRDAGSPRAVEAAPAAPRPALAPATPSASGSTLETETSQGARPSSAAAPAPAPVPPSAAVGTPAPSPVPPSGKHTTTPVPPSGTAAPAPARPAPVAATPASPVSAAPSPVRPHPVPKTSPDAPHPAVPSTGPADPARLARLQADSLRRAEAKALREAQRAEQAARNAGRQALAKRRADSLKAAKFTRDSLAIFLALARKDSLKAARARRDSLLAVQAQARKDSLQQARLLREMERAQKAEADAARLALARAKADSLKAIKDAAEAETLLRRSVNQAFKAETEEMRGLYNRFALGYPGLRGEVVVNLLVSPSGEIERGVIQSSTTGVKMFDQLVLGNILEWKIRPFKASEPKAILVAVNFPIQ